MKQALFLIALLTLVGCSHMGNGGRPADVIAPDSMVQIMADIHIADAVADQKFGTDKPNRGFTNAMYTRIYELHHITAAQYKASFTYYETHPAAMDKVYEQVITEISKRAALMKKAK